MLNKFVCVLLMSLTITSGAFAFPQLPIGAVVVKLYAQEDFDNSNPVTRPIKRQPSMGITVYVENGSIFFQDFDEPFRMLLLDSNSKEEVFSTTVLPGQTSEALPLKIKGNLFLCFEFSSLSYSGELYI